VPVRLREDSQRIDAKKSIFNGLFRMKPKLVPEMVNSAQISERREIKKGGSTQSSAEEPPICAL
jgi:hypothetical protein